MIKLITPADNGVANKLPPIIFNEFGVEWKTETT